MGHTPPESIEIQREEDGDSGRYFVHLAGAEAELTYTNKDAHTRTLDHTGVPEAMRGRSVPLCHNRCPLVFR